jgi:hypothetical protein
MCVWNGDAFVCVQRIALADWLASNPVIAYPSPREFFVGTEDRKSVV